MKIKNIIRSIIILSSLGSFCYYLIASKKGILSYLALKKDIAIDQQEIDQLANEITSLRQSLDDWYNNPSAKELAARNELNMTYTNEKIYIIK